MDLRAVLVGLALGASCAFAQDCDLPTLTISNAAQASNIPCRTLEGSVLIDSGVRGDVRLEGPEVIGGNLIVNGVSEISSLSSSSLVSVGGTIDISSNNPSLGVDLASLEWAYEFAINNTRSFEVPALTFVNNSIRFGQNSFEIVSAKQLTRVGGTMSFTNNSDVSRLEFPLLERIDAALVVADNPSLAFIDSFPELERVTGAIFLDGDFKYVELPQLSEFYGTFLLRSTQRLGDTCAAFQDMADKDPTNREFECQGEYEPEAEEPAANTPNSNNSKSEENGSPGLGGGAIAGIVVGGVALLALIATLIFCLMRRRQKRKAEEAKENEQEEEDHQPAVPEIHGTTRYELAAPTPELAGSEIPDHYASHEIDGITSQPTRSPDSDVHEDGGERAR